MPKSARHILENMPIMEFSNHLEQIKHENKFPSRADALKKLNVQEKIFEAYFSSFSHNQKSLNYEKFTTLGVTIEALAIANNWDVTKSLNAVKKEREDLMGRPIDEVSKDLSRCVNQGFSMHDSAIELHSTLTVLKKYLPNFIENNTPLKWTDLKNSPLSLSEIAIKNNLDPKKNLGEQCSNRKEAATALLIDKQNSNALCDLALDKISQTLQNSITKKLNLDACAKELGVKSKQLYHYLNQFGLNYGFLKKSEASFEQIAAQIGYKTELPLAKQPIIPVDPFQKAQSLWEQPIEKISEKLAECQKSKLNLPASAKAVGFSSSVLQSYIQCFVSDRITLSWEEFKLSKKNLSEYAVECGLIPKLSLKAQSAIIPSQQDFTTRYSGPFPERTIDELNEIFDECVKEDLSKKQSAEKFKTSPKVIDEFLCYFNLSYQEFKASYQPLSKLAQQLGYDTHIALKYLQVEKIFDEFRALSQPIPVSENAEKRSAEEQPMDVMRPEKRVAIETMRLDPIHSLGAYTNNPNYFFYHNEMLLTESPPAFVNPNVPKGLKKN